MLGKLPIHALLLLGALGAAQAIAADPAAVANGPAAGPLRELQSDRPDATESPYTVDAGHAQLELDWANRTRDQAADARSVAWEAAPFNLRLGLTRNFEAGAFWAPYRQVTVAAPDGTRMTVAGARDLTVRGKWNFAGNDGGTAYGMIVDLTLPTASRGLGDGEVGGAILLPANLELGGGWELGAMTGAGVQSSGAGTRRRGVWINTASVGHGVVGRLAGYQELAAQTGAGAPVATFDTGLTYQLDANTQVDAGVQFGLSGRADDVQMFTGMTRQF